MWDDVGGIPTAEDPGFATIMAGAHTLQQNDDALLKAMTGDQNRIYPSNRVQRPVFRAIGGRFDALKHRPEPHIYLIRII